MKTATVSSTKSLQAATVSRAVDLIRRQTLGKKSTTRPTITTAVTVTMPASWGTGTERAISVKASSAYVLEMTDFPARAMRQPIVARTGAVTSAPILTTAVPAGENVCATRCAKHAVHRG